MMYRIGGMKNIESLNKTKSMNSVSISGSSLFDEYLFSMEIKA